MPRTETFTVTRSDEQPTWLRRTLGAVRSYFAGPLTMKSPEIARAMGYYGPTSSGIQVSEETALAFSAVWSAVTMISDDIASLPLNLYKRLDSGGKEKFENHPLYRLLHDAPNPEMTTMVWRRTMQAHLLIWQNAYAEIERDSAGRPVAVWPLVPERVTPFREDGVLRYRVTNPSGSTVTIDEADMLHLVGYSYDGSVGCSLVAKARESIALGLAAEKFGGSFFGNGATFGGVISYPGARPTELSEQSYREQLEARHQGVQRAHKMLALYNGAKFEQMGTNPNEAQFLETRVFQIREVARWFRMPPHKLGDLADATYSNVEQMDSAYLSSCIRPWLVLWQQELSKKLIAKVEQRLQFIEHDTHGFLSVDASARAALYTAEFNVAGVTPNEIRGYENRGPMEGGNRLFVMRNMVPLDRLDEIIDAEIAKSKAAPPTLPDIVPAPPKTASFEDLEARMVVHAERLSVEAAKAAAAEARAVQADAAVSEARAEVSSLDAERAAALALVADKERAASELERAHEAALSTLRDETASEVAAREARWAEERARLAADVESAQSARNDTDVMLSVAEKALRDAQTERDAAKSGEESAHAKLASREAARDALTAELVLVRSRAASHEAEAAALRQEADALKAAHVEARAEGGRLSDEIIAAKQERDGVVAQLSIETAVVAELRSSLAAYVAQVDEASRVAREAESLRALADAKVAERSASLTVADQVVSDTSAAYRSAMRRLGIVAASHRALIVDAVSRVLQREMDRARKAQTSPEKMRAWVESFYPVHADVVRSTLRPAIGAWAACAGSDVDAILDREVEAHIGESSRAITLVADTDDLEAMAVALERVLRRWETERPNAVADRLFKEGSQPWLTAA